MTDVKTEMDLIAVVPDGDMEATVRALLARPSDLGIRRITFDVKRHLQRDAGCRSAAHDFLRLWLKSFRYAVVLFDHEGCGREQKSREIVETEVEERLEANGWRNRCSVIVISPELESWVWSESDMVDAVLGWTGRIPALREWVRSETDFWQGEHAKPKRPKEAFEAALRKVRTPRSPALFAELAEQVPTAQCIDPSFQKLRDVLQRWFPALDKD